MRRHKVLIWLIGVSAAILILSAFWVVTKRLIVHVTLVGTEMGVAEQYDYLMGRPQWEMIPVLWRSGYAKTLLRTIMIGLSFFGGIRIGILLLRNREKLRKA